MKTKLAIVIEVEYETNGVPIQELREHLAYIPKHASGEGMFTGDTEAEVESWDYRFLSAAEL